MSQRSLKAWNWRDDTASPGLIDESSLECRAQFLTGRPSGPAFSDSGCHWFVDRFLIAPSSVLAEICRRSAPGTPGRRSILSAASSFQRNHFRGCDLLPDLASTISGVIISTWHTTTRTICAGTGSIVMGMTESVACEATYRNLASHLLTTNPPGPPVSFLPQYRYQIDAGGLARRRVACQQPD
jgi:hypothetical protein